MNRNAVVNKKSSAKSVCERIVYEVICGNIRPGEKLAEEFLASQFGVGRHAVREALYRLDQDDLLVRRPKVGTFMREISDKEMLETYEVRAAIEGVVTRKVAQVATDKQLEKLAEMAEEVDCGPDDVYRRRMQNDHRFHRKLAELSGIRHAQRIMRLSHLHALCSRFSHQITFLGAEQDGSSVQEPGHRKVVEVLKAHDPDAAEAVIKEHLLAARDWTLHQMERVRKQRRFGVQELSRGLFYKERAAAPR